MKTIVLTAAAADAYEDGADAATFASALAGQGPSDALPASVSADILSGHGRVRAFREWRSMSPETLSAQLGVDTEALLKLETGERILDHETAARISEALDLPSGWLAI